MNSFIAAAKPSLLLASATTFAARLTLSLAYHIEMEKPARSNIEMSFITPITTISGFGIPNNRGLTDNRNLIARWQFSSFESSPGLFRFRRFRKD
jgi:hypothetical protein